MQGRNKKLQVVMMGATGAVGGHAVNALKASGKIRRLTLLGRRTSEELAGEAIEQKVIDVLDPQTYDAYLPGHQAAVCTLGVGQPSKVSQERFLAIDRDAVIAFATACKKHGIAHFELLNSIGADSASRSFYLRAKGELCDALVALGFERLSLFQPSMILTPTNRYGFSQAVTLAVWPKLGLFLQGPLKKYRGVPVETLGRAMAANLFRSGSGVEFLEWEDFGPLAATVDPG